MKAARNLVLICVATAAMFPAAARSEPGNSLGQTQLAFVQEYLREVAENDDIREQNLKDIAEASEPQASLMASIRGCERITLALGADKAVLRGVILASPLDDLPNMIAKAYDGKIAFCNDLTSLSTTFLATLKAGVDYGALSASVPKLTARNEFLDKTLFELSALVTATLIDERPDHNGHVSHLVISAKDRLALIQTIDDDFGAKLAESHPVYGVESAVLFKQFLLGNHKSADDP